MANANYFCSNFIDVITAVSDEELVKAVDKLQFKHKVANVTVYTGGFYVLGY